MKVSYNWLQEFVKVSLDPYQLAERLTMTGAEVEAVEAKDPDLSGSDFILDIGVTPNRPDLLGIRGVAREVAALTGQRFKGKRFGFKEDGPSIDSLTSVTIRDFALCPRYCARLIRGISVKPSPDWMQRRLLECGFNPVNNVVDATNYVLLEMGHPLHAFDYGKLEGGRIVVRRAGSGEGITTIDGVNRTLQSAMLVIADARKPVAVAGVMGGRDSEIGDSTVDVLLESAYFNPISIRRTSRVLGLVTEASRRFERTADPEAVPEALEKVTSLILKLAGGEAAKGRIDRKERVPQRPSVRIRVSRAADLLGSKCDRRMVRQTLGKLGLKLSFRRGDSLIFRIPSWRPDLTREVDLIEEVARLSGYDRISPVMPTTEMTYRKNSLGERIFSRTRDVLCGLGLDEVITYSFLSPRTFEQLRLPFLHPLRSAPAIENPVNKEQSLLRTTLIPGLLEVVQRNVNQNLAQIEIFELGTVFTSLRSSKLPRERKLLSLAVCRREEKSCWCRPSSPPDFYSLKGILEIYFQCLALKNISFRPVEHPAFQPGRAARVLIGNKKAGIIGAVDGRVLENFSLPGAVYLAELEMDALLSRRRPAVRYQRPPQYPAVRRDIAVVVRETMPYGEVGRAIQRARPAILESYALFDVYRGDPVPPGKKSFAFSLKYRSPYGTLLEEKVNKVHQAFQESLVRTLDCGFRE